MDKKLFPVLDQNMINDLTYKAYSNPRKFKEAVEYLAEVYDVTNKALDLTEISSTFSLLGFEKDADTETTFNTLEEFARSNGVELLNHELIKASGVEYESYKTLVVSVYMMLELLFLNITVMPSRTVPEIMKLASTLDSDTEKEENGEHIANAKPLLGSYVTPSLLLFSDIDLTNSQEQFDSLGEFLLENSDGKFKDLPKEVVGEACKVCLWLIVMVNGMYVFKRDDIKYRPENFSPVNGDLQTPHTLIDLVYTIYKDDKEGLYDRLMSSIFKYYSYVGVMPNFERDLLISYDKFETYPISAIKELGYEVKELVDSMVSRDSKEFLEDFRRIIVAEASAVHNALQEELNKEQKENENIKENNMNNKINFEKLGQLTNMDAGILENVHSNFGDKGLGNFVQGVAEGSEEAKEDVNEGIRIVAEDKSLWEKFRELPWWQQVLIAAGATAAVGGIGYLVYKTFFAKEDEWTEIQVLNEGN